MVFSKPFELEGCGGLYELTVFMLETLKLSETLKSSRDDFNALDNFNVSSIKTVIYFYLLWRHL